MRYKQTKVELKFCDTPGCPNRVYIDESHCDVCREIQDENSMKPKIKPEEKKEKPNG
jgi:hypothetical protein